MTEQHPSWLASIFRFIVAMRWGIVGIFALLLGPSVYFALKVPQDNSIDRLIVQSDPDYIAAHEFEKVHPGVKVQFDYLENEAFKAKLPTLLQSKDGPSVFHS